MVQRRLVSWSGFQIAESGDAGHPADSSERTLGDGKLMSGTK
jgi:hypothetical protein